MSWESVENSKLMSCQIGENGLGVCDLYRTSLCLVMYTFKVLRIGSKHSSVVPTTSQTERQGPVSHLHKFGPVMTYRRVILSVVSCGFLGRFGQADLGENPLMLLEGCANTFIHSNVFHCLHVFCMELCAVSCVN